MKKKFFLRCDDAASASPAFLKVFRALLSARLPAVYAVIPSLASPALRRLLNGHPEAGRLFETAQHGLTHKDHSGNRFLRQEFGPARDFSRQLKDIRDGARLMRTYFGRLAAPVFVPPFHVYNADTVEALGRAGLKALSASKKIPGPRRGGTLFLPAAINVNDYDLDLKARPLDLAALKAKTLRALRAPGPAVGTYFHHADLRGADLKIFTDYLDFLNGLKAGGLITPVLFTDLLREYRRRRVQ